MNRREGFTLVELLVVITIIAVLISLLVPAVQAVRETARRMQCANNLKQIGLAIQGYQAATGSFPPGNILTNAALQGTCPGQARAGIDYPSPNGTNWMISILPYLEQRALYETYNFKVPNEAPENRRVRETPLSTYVCPSDRAIDQLVVPAEGPAAAAAMNVPYMPGSYRAVAGRSDGWTFLDAAGFAYYPTAWRGAMHVVGIAGLSTERPRDLRDGASHTLMVGESATRSNPGQRTLWAYSHAYYALSSATPQERILLGDYDRCVQAGGTGKERPCKRLWGSGHSDGMNFLLCDGAVRFLSTTVDMETFAALATIDGEERATLPRD